MIMEKYYGFLSDHCCILFPLCGITIYAGNIVVVRVGDGSASLTVIQQLFFLDEYTTAAY